MKHSPLLTATVLALATTVASTAFAAQTPTLLAQATASEDAAEPAKKIEEAAENAAEAVDEVKEDVQKIEEAAPEAKADEAPVKAAEEDGDAVEKPGKKKKAKAEDADSDGQKPAKKKKVKAETAPEADETPKAESTEAEAAPEPAKSAEQPEAVEPVKEAEEVKPKKKKRKAKAVEPAEDKPAKRAKKVETEKTEEVTEDAAKPDQPASTDNSETAGQQPAATEAPIVVEADQSEERREAAKKAEKQRRAEKRKRRRELIGAGAAGVAIGAVLQGALGGKVVEDEGDRFVVERDGRYFVRKDENVLLRRNGVEVRTEELEEGRQRSVATRPNGVEIVTLRDRNGNILKRSKRFPNGDEVVLIDNQNLEEYAAPRELNLGELELGIPLDEYVVETTRADRRAYRRALLAEPVEKVEREYSLREVRDNRRLRAKLRRIDLDSINFNTGSATVSRSQIAKLDELGNTLATIIEQKPDEVFLIEGHTDAVGSDLSNLTLSDRRAETVAQILIGSYGVPPENLVTEGYGEQDLKVMTEEALAENRRVTVRRITPLLRRASN